LSIEKNKVLKIVNVNQLFSDVLIQAVEKTNNYKDWFNFLRENSLTSSDIGIYSTIPQGLKWHPEFEVSKHIYLVSISLHRQGVDSLLEAAFFHDWGKVFSTNVGKDRIYSYGHAEKSLPHIDEKKDNLKFYDMTRSITERHMMFYEVGDPRISNNFYMKEFVKADKVMSLVLFHEFFFYEKDNNLKKQNRLFENQEQSKNTIYIACGISGSGKSKYINETFENDIIVCPDKIREELTGDISNQSRNEEVWKIAKDRLLRNIENYGKAVLDATNVQKSRRIEFMSAFNGCKKVALVFPVDLELAISRIKNDIDNNKNRSKVPENVVKKQHESFHHGLKSLVHEFNEVQWIGEKGIVEQIKEKLEEELKKEKDDEK